jgi:hypothetical protein
VTLPEVVAGNLAGKFGEISLYNQHADFELGSDSNSNSTSPWAIVCESATQPSRAASPLLERFTRGLATLAGSTRRLPLRVGPARRTYPSTTQTPTPSPATTQTLTLSPAYTQPPHTISTSGQILMNPSPRTILQSNPCQDQLPAWL